jgi:hypothetical protein
VFEYLFSSLLPSVFARLLLLLLMAIEKSEFSAVPPWMILRCLQEIVVINQTIMSGEKTEIVTRNCHQMRFVCRARKGENVYTQNRRFPPFPLPLSYCLLKYCVFIFRSHKNDFIQ